MFDCSIGIDYSGAGASDTRLAGLRVYRAERRGGPVEVRSPAGQRRHWTRRELAAWLAETLAAGPRAVVGIDHGLSFPLAYFERHGAPRRWPAFLDDFHRHWPTDEAGVRVEDIRRGARGAGAGRRGEATWRRLTEQRASGAKSVFHFDVPGSVAKSTHAGLPWLRQVRARAGQRLHVWPYDGWDVAPDRSMIAEVYPSLWRDRFPRGRRTGDQHDAFVVAATLQAMARDGTLMTALHPELTADEIAKARIEGWILGVT